MIMHSNTNRIPKKINEFEFEEASDGLIAYAGESGNVCYLNPSATLIYSLCNGKLNVDQITSFIAKAFSLPELPIDDVRQSLDELEKATLVEWVAEELAPE